MPPSYEHKDLIIQLKSGNRSVFEYIYHQHKHALYSLAITYLKDAALAEDALQEVFIKLWKKRESINEQLSIKGFLFTCMKHHVLNVIRTEQNRIKIAAKAYMNTPPFHEDTIEQLSYKESKDLLIRGINKLSEGKRKIVKLNVLEGYTYREIAHILNLSEHTVRSQISQSRKILKAYLADHQIICFLLFLFLQD